MSATEYSDSVREWLTQAYQWQAIAYSFPSYLAYQASVQQQQQSQNNSSQPGNNSTSTPTPTQTATTTPNNVTPLPEWHEFTIPPIWKRVLAEIIDFFFLFLLKLIVTFAAVDVLSIVDLDRYDMSFLAAVAAGGTDLDLQTALEFTSDFAFLEMIHRLIVCVFEALCLHRSTGSHPGGATPGKLILGLRVVSCAQITAMPDPDRVQISPAKDLGIMGACVRAVLKNAAIAFFVPVFFTFIYNRTVYDIMSKSIVVEVNYDLVRQRRRRQNNNNH